MLAFNIYLAEYDYSGQTDLAPFPWPWKEKAIKKLPGGRRLVVDYRETQSIIEEMEVRYPDYTSVVPMPPSELLKLNIEAIAHELSQGS